jgi:hypothetical protein
LIKEKLLIDGEEISMALLAQALLWIAAAEKSTAVSEIKETAVL